MAAEEAATVESVIASGRKKMMVQWTARATLVEVVVVVVVVVGELLKESCLQVPTMRAVGGDGDVLIADNQSHFLR